MEQTLAIVKPDGFKFAGQIEDRIEEESLRIVQSKTTRLSSSECGDFYAEHKAKGFFDELCTYMSSGNVRILVLEGRGAIAKWRALMGPTDAKLAKAENPKSLRALYGSSKQRNAVHGSDSFSSAEREIGFFFPEMRAESAASEAVAEYLATELTPTLTEGLAELCKARPEDPVMWLANWLAEHAE